MNTKQQKLEAFSRLLDVMDDLREKCPWDRVQTFKSLKNNTIEETCELADAIEKEDLQEIKKELGDLALHVVFYSKIASETGSFDVADVLNGICEKLIFRHPHIYGNVKAEDEETVKKNWEKLKLKEGKKSVLEGVPNSLPSLIKAYRIQEKVKGIGFDFENNSQILEKINEEISEFIAENEIVKREEEFGDILFSLVNFARYNGIHAEDALQKTNLKFIRRFQKMEKLARARDLSLPDMPLAEMDKLWNEAKS